MYGLYTVAYKRVGGNIIIHMLRKSCRILSFVFLVVVILYSSTAGCAVLATVIQLLGEKKDESTFEERQMFDICI
jgi:hypothetical protein